MKKINETSKISDIIKANEKSIDVIASINKNFIKLKNPILRKLLAPRVSIKQAASIGGVHSNVLLKALAEIGFDSQYTQINDNSFPETETKIIDMNKNDNVVLDVRPILDSGVDPFKKIMETLKTMTDDQNLLIINTFEPIPLLNILKDKGYNYETTRPEDGVVHTLLTKSTDATVLKEKKTVNKKDWSFSEAQEFYSNKLHEVYVRHLEMPLPMVTILEEVEKVDAGSALFVHHKKLPQYLIPELENRGFAFVSNEIDDQNIKLIIYKS